MISDTRTIPKSETEVRDRLELALSSGNFRIVEQTENSIRFEHGSYFSLSPSLFPKHGSVRIYNLSTNRTRISYRIECAVFPKYCLILFAVITCWLIFPVYIAYRTLFYHPKALMEDLYPSS